MIKKVVFTIIVALIVILFYKLKTREVDETRDTQKNELDEGKFTSKLAVFILVGFVGLFSVFYTGLHWLDQQRELTVRIISSDNVINEYQTKKKSLKGRKFTTLDGRVIEVGNNDTIEVIEQ